MRAAPRLSVAALLVALAGSGAGVQLECPPPVGPGGGGAHGAQARPQRLARTEARSRLQTATHAGSRSWRPCGSAFAGKRSALPPHRLLLALRGGAGSDADSDVFLEVYPEPRAESGGGAGQRRQSPARSPARSPAKSPRTAPGTQGGPPCALGKRRHLPTEKWVDYPQEGLGGGHDYAGEGAVPAAPRVPQPANACAAAPPALHPWAQAPRPLLASAR